MGSQSIEMLVSKTDHLYGLLGRRGAAVVFWSEIKAGMSKGSQVDGGLLNYITYQHVQRALECV